MAAATPVFTDDEKKMLGIALNALKRSVLTTSNRNQMPLVVSALSKQLEVIEVLSGKVRSL